MAIYNKTKIITSQSACAAVVSFAFGFFQPSCRPWSQDLVFLKAPSKPKCGSWPAVGAFDI